MTDDVRLIEPLSKKDTMFAGDAAHYLSVGRSALDVVRYALSLRSAPQVTRVLDMGCGYGRVLRHLRAAWPDAALHACDVEADATAFCAQAFGATAIPAPRCPGDLVLPGGYDVIWVGSVITHLEAADTRALLHILTRALTDTGVCLVSSHGRLVRQRLSSGGHADYGLSATAASTVVRGFDGEGYGYHDYQGWEKYGVSCLSPEWAFATARAEGGSPFFFAEAAWDHHHDVIGLRREGSTT